MNGRHPATKNDGLAASAVLVADCAAAIADSASCSLLAARSRCSAFGNSWISSLRTSVTPPRPVMSNNPMLSPPEPVFELLRSGAQAVGFGGQSVDADF